MESNKKKLGNKGFSLVELIVVIAIMAILIGIMAPNLMSYIERTNVAADIQLADTIRTAVKTAMMDPVVLMDANGQARVDAFKDDTRGEVDLTDLVIEDAGGNGGTASTATIFGKTIANILGEADPTSITQTWIAQQIRSKASDGDRGNLNITVEYKDNDVIVTLENTNNGNNLEIVVP